MAARTASTDDSADEAVNEIRLRGRLAAVATTRVLPSGDEMVTFRLVVARPARARRSVSSARIDTLDCAVFASGIRRRSLQWQPGDVLEIQGSLRRRFFRTGGGPASRYEVEVASATRVARASA